MEVFKVDFKSHLKSGELIIWCAIVGLISPYILSIMKNVDVNSVRWIGGAVFFVIAMPAFIVHINYYFVNHGDIFKYSFYEREITIIHKGKPTTFSLDEIDYIKRYMSFNQGANRAFVTPWEGYNHSYIHLKNGQMFTVTSLLVPNLRLPIDEEKIIIKKHVIWLARRY